MTSLSLQAAFHQGDPNFSDLSRGRQCAFMSLSALLYSQFWPVPQWTQIDLHEILNHGDSMYLHAFQQQLIPDVDSLLITELPNTVTSIDDSLWSITFLSPFLGPIGNQTLCSAQGLIRAEEAFENAFHLSSLLLLILDGYMMAVINIENLYFIFDPHSRGNNGMPVSDGTAILLTFDTIHKLIHHTNLLSAHLNVKQFEIVPVIFHKRGIVCDQQQSASGANVNYNTAFKMPDSNQCCKKRKFEGSDSDYAEHSKLKFSKKVHVPCGESKASETQSEQIRQENDREKHEMSITQKQKRNRKRPLHCKMKMMKETDTFVLCKTDYLKEYDSSKNGPLHEQNWAKENMKNFHRSTKYNIVKCTVCSEAWPIKTRPRNLNQYTCTRCAQDKRIPKRFSVENNLIPSTQPIELQGLSQVEEMLISRALPVMRVYVKPGGQRAYSGHCLNLPQDVRELANTLPHYPKDISAIIVRKKGKNETFKDVVVRRHKVENALFWLIRNNPQYRTLTINQAALKSLPENGVPEDLLTVQTENDNEESNDSPEVSAPDRGQYQSEEDILYNKETEVSSFLPIPQLKAPEIQAVQQELLNTIDWPTVGSEAFSEFKTPYLATMAFPTLFPDGKGDPTNPQIHHDVSFAEKIKHLIKIGHHTSSGWQYPFAKHPRFSYWALNMILRSRTLQQGSIFLNQNPGEAHLTTADLQQMAQDNNSSLLMTKISRYVANVTGSHSYWHKVKEDLKAIIHHVGPPTFFFTFSYADMHWPELHSLFSVNSESITSQTRRQNVIDNPHITDWFFTQRFESFVKHWLYNCLDADWHWFRYEYQATRGSIHCHGVAKLKNDPGLCELTEVALQGYLAEQQLADLDHQTDISLLCDLNATAQRGKEASQTVCRYVDWLLSTYNPMPPDLTGWQKPNPHPCQKDPVKITTDEQSENDFHDLLNTVQRHTHCSTAYCLKKTGNSSDLTCRFHFPFDDCEDTALQFEPIHSNSKTPKFRAKIVTKRNDPRVNNYQRLQLQGWRANCDIQVVIDYHACIQYMAKYASKPEPKSPMINNILKKILQTTDQTAQTSTVIKKLMIKTLGERDFSAQETMHQLLSLKFYSSTYKVFNVSLNGSRRLKKVQQHDEPDCNATQESVVDIYANRHQFLANFPSLMEMNFITFVTTYTLKKSKLVKRSNLYEVPRVYPTYSPNPKADSFGLHCKYQLLKFKPWHTQQGNAWDNLEPCDENFISAWDGFLQTDYARIHVPKWAENCKLSMMQMSVASTLMKPIICL